MLVSYFTRYLFCIKMFSFFDILSSGILTLRYALHSTYRFSRRCDMIFFSYFLRLISSDFVFCDFDMLGLDILLPENFAFDVSPLEMMRYFLIFCVRYLAALCLTRAGLAIVPHRAIRSWNRLPSEVRRSRVTAYYDGFS